MQGAAEDLGRDQGVGLCAKLRGKLVVSSQANQNKAFWRIISNCLEKRPEGDGIAGREVERKGFLEYLS